MERIKEEIKELQISVPMMIIIMCFLNMETKKTDFYLPFMGIQINRLETYLCLLKIHFNSMTEK